jgi:hypothetical protein
VLGGCIAAIAGFLKQIADLLRVAAGLFGVVLDDLVDLVLLVGRQLELLILRE